MKVAGNTVEGILKVEDRTLFYRDAVGRCREIRPLCVLDFYVHESVQRNGVGKQLFSFMLEAEKLHPKKLAYDRPSSKLIRFLDKYYNLKHFIPQNNNFVVYDDYFRHDEPLQSSVPADNFAAPQAARGLHASNSVASIFPTLASQSNYRAPLTNSFLTAAKQQDFHTNPTNFDKFREKLNTGVADIRRNNWKAYDLPMTLPVHEPAERPKLADLFTKPSLVPRQLPRRPELQQLNREIRRTEEELVKLQGMAGQRKNKLSNWDYQWL